MPKKRGPKTDVLEALLKRVDGLEAKLKDKNGEQLSPISPNTSTSGEMSRQNRPEPANPETVQTASKRIAIDTKTSPTDKETAVYTPDTPNAKLDTLDLSPWLLPY